MILLQPCGLGRRLRLRNMIWPNGQVLSYWMQVDLI